MQGKEEVQTAARVLSSSLTALREDIPVERTQEAQVEANDLTKVDVEVECTGCDILGDSRGRWMYKKQDVQVDGW